MSTYRRDPVNRRCQMWWISDDMETGHWCEVAYDAPEVNPRKEGEGMVVGSMDSADWKWDDGPLTFRVGKDVLTGFSPVADPEPTIVEAEDASR